MLGNQLWPIELTLTNRDSMRFRMLLGRAGLPSGILIDSKHSYLAGEPDPQHASRFAAETPA